MDSVKLKNPTVKRGSNKIQGSQYDIVNSDCCAIGELKNKVVIIDESPANYFYYYLGGYFGNPDNFSPSKSKEEDDHACILRNEETINEDHAEFSSNINRKDRCHPHRPLHLCLEEAFYLSYALGVLGIKISGKVSNLLEIWQHFNRIQPDFISYYVAYHHFRAKNWVVRSGLKLGSDFTLYKDGPPYFHASYAVKIHQIKEKDANSLPFRNWIDLSCQNRVINQVVKELIVCYVIWPKNIDEEQLMSSPSYLSEFSVQELLIRRWVASEEREQSDI